MSSLFCTFIVSFFVRLTLQRDSPCPCSLGVRPKFNVFLGTRKIPVFSRFAHGSAPFYGVRKFPFSLRFLMANLLFIAFAPSIRMRFAFYSQVPFIACYKPFQLFAFVSPYLFTFSPPRVALWPSLPPSRAFLAPRLRHKKRLKLYAPACYKPFKYLPIVSLSPLLPAPLLACLYLFSTAQAPLPALIASSLN